MSFNSHDNDPDDSQKKYRTNTTPDADQATHTADPARKHVVQHVAQSGQATPQSSPQTAQPKSEDYHPEQPLTKESGRHPGEVSPQLGQDSGSDWQESQQMGQTGRGGVQNPQTNP